MILYKALLVGKKDFAYECLETRDIFFDGYTLLQMIYFAVKPNPNMIVDANLQLKMETLTISPVIICRPPRGMFENKIQACQRLGWRSVLLHKTALGLQCVHAQHLHAWTCAPTTPEL